MARAIPLISKRPIPDSYVTREGAVAAGAYPGSPPSATSVQASEKLAAFLDSGLTVFIDLTGLDEGLQPYAHALRELGERRGINITHQRFPIADMGICEPAQMSAILDAIDAHVAAGRAVYVHCWGGVGRTGTVIGCWLARHGHTGDDALAEVARLFCTMSAEKLERHKRWGSPQTEAQRAMVRSWSERSGVRAATAWPLLRPRADVESSLRDRMRGALVGLAVGDAVGTTVEFQPPGTFSPVTDMTGGGPFRLRVGEWTDDTSMALCLAESLITCRTFDATDQMNRYLRWWRVGHLSSNGRCFDIGTTVSRALRSFERTGNPIAGPTDEHSAGNGSIMRLAPIPLFFLERAEDAISIAADASRTTHGAPVAVDACRYLAALIIGAARGTPKDELLSPQFAPSPGYWSRDPLHPVIAEIANGSFKRKSPPQIRGTGYVADCLEAALWAFYHASDFREGCLEAVNLGDDADTTAAVYGQLAGAHYGESAIPTEWRSRLARKPLIDRFAELLFQLALEPLPARGKIGELAAREAEKMLKEAGYDAARVLQQLDDEVTAAKEEMGVMSFYMGGSVHAQAMAAETRMLLRVALGLSLGAHR